jgi:hypothetical protein
VSATGLRRATTELAVITAARARDAAKAKKSKAKRKPSDDAHRKAECALRDHKTLGRYLRQTATGRLQIDRRMPSAAVLSGVVWMTVPAEPWRVTGCRRPSSVGDARPGGVTSPFGDAGQQEREPVQEKVGADARFDAVEHGARACQVDPPTRITARNLT